MAKVKSSRWPPEGIAQGVITPSFSEIATAITKRANRDEDDDGRHVIENIRIKLLRN
jgi:hypothetical protein